MIVRYSYWFVYSSCVLVGTNNVCSFRVQFLTQGNALFVSFFRGGPEGEEEEGLRQARLFCGEVGG